LLRKSRIFNELPAGCPLAEQEPLVQLARMRRSIEWRILGSDAGGQQAELDQHVFELCSFCVDERLLVHPVVQHLRRELGFFDDVYDLPADPGELDAAEPAEAPSTSETGKKLRVTVEL
jgi:hypothetical protein